MPDRKQQDEQSPEELAGTVLMGMGPKFLQEIDDKEDVEAPDPELLGAYLENRLSATQRRQVEKTLKESRGARKMLADIITSARETDYHDELIENAPPQAKAEEEPSGSPFEALGDLIRWLAMPRRLAAAGALAFCMILVYPTYRYARNWPQRALDRAGALADSGDWPAALESLDPVLAKSKPGSDWHRRAEDEIQTLYLAQGRRMESEERFEEARDFYAEGTRKLPSSATLLSRSALSRVKLSRAQSGRPGNYSLIDPTPGVGGSRDMDALIGLANSTLISGADPAERSAIRLQFELALHEDPEHLPALIGLADFLTDLGELGSAQTLLDQGRGIDAGDADLLNAQGRLLVRQGRWEEAETKFLEAVSANADHAAAHANLVLIHQAQDETDQAQAHRDKLRALGLENLVEP